MKKILLSLTVAAASALALTATGASAQPYDMRHDRPMAERGSQWVSINERQAMLDRRIDRGLRDGSLNRREAGRLRMQFNDIARLETRYRVGGLSNWERADLDRRFDRLSSRIRSERHDDQYGYGYGHERDWRR